MNTSTLRIPDWTEVDFTNSKDITVIYCRLSAEDASEGESNSISNQRLILARVAETEGFKNPVAFIDDGFSGSNFNRPAITKALELVEAGKVCNFIVKDLSRLGRDYLRTGQLLESVFPAHSVRFISLNEQVDSAKNSAQDAYMLPLVNIFNEWYSRQCSEKIRLSKHTKAKNGEKIGWIAPYGYLNNPDNRKEWLVDEYASQIVKRVFRECIAGRTPTEIARDLENDKILTPANYKKKLGLSNHRILETNPYLWKTQMIWQMLEKEEYIGSTINLKTAKISYKQRRFRLRPRKDWLIFPDTHQAIISKEDFEVAHKMLGHKRVVQRRNWKDQPGHENLFAGLVFCENGHKLSFCPQQKNNLNLDHYKCYSYKRAGQTCSGAHYLRKVVLEELVLTDINQMLSAIRFKEDELLQKLQVKFDLHQNTRLTNIRKEVELKKKRFEELDIIIQKLYEKQLLGEISNERFSKLCESYEVEQTELKQFLAEYQAKLDEQIQSTQQIEKFMRQIRKYTLIEKLTPEIVNQLIDKIVVHQPTGRGKKRQAKIEIHYRFIGEI